MNDTVGKKSTAEDFEAAVVYPDCLCEQWKRIADESSVKYYNDIAVRIPFPT